jgi:hypothetical protein
VEGISTKEGPDRLAIEGKGDKRAFLFIFLGGVEGSPRGKIPNQTKPTNLSKSAGFSHFGPFFVVPRDSQIDKKKRIFK